MKKIIGILLIFISTTAYCQFPAPTNFEFGYEYIMMEQSGYCAGQWLYGPTYCSHFQWGAPDVNATSAIFEHYNLYYAPWNKQDTIILTKTTDMFFDMEIGIIGTIWVTAVYSNPDGESDPSNIIENETLPISVDEYDREQVLDVYYDYVNQEIKIGSAEDFSQLRVYDFQGRLLHSKKLNRNAISIQGFPNGVYIVEVVENGGDIFRKKIVK